MKVRIGLGMPGGDADLGAYVDDAERLGFDSLWVSERVGAPTLDPIVAMTFIAARTERMKLGASVMVLPGRNPVLLAKALASIDVVSGGRLLPAFGLGVAHAPEHQAFGVQREHRVPWFEEALPLLRRLWAEDRVTHHGTRFHLDDAVVLPKPIRRGFDVWMGGASAPELRRCGRLADGWIAAFCRPATVRSGIGVVQEAAAGAGRTVDPEHFGVTLLYTGGPVPAPLEAAVAANDPGADAGEVIARSRAQLADLVAAHVAVGASKFVVVPMLPQLPADGWTAELEELAATLLPLADPVPSGAGVSA